MEQQPGTGVIEVRFFDVAPENLDDFVHTATTGTIPLMAECGITVLASGRLMNDEGFYLVRRFDSATQRMEQAPKLYEHPDWGQFDEEVTRQTRGYLTALIPAGVLDAGAPLQSEDARGD